MRIRNIVRVANHWYGITRPEGEKEREKKERKKEGKGGDVVGAVDVWNGHIS